MQSRRFVLIVGRGVWFRARRLYVAAELAALLLLAALLHPAGAADPSTTPGDDRLQLAVEALQRLKGMDLEASPALKAAVLKVLKNTEGTRYFVEVVRDFKLKGQNPALLQYAIQHPTEASGADAIRLIIADDGLNLLRDTLNGPDAASLLRALSNVPDKTVAPLIEAVVSDGARDLAVRREGVHALAQTRTGAEFLLSGAAADGKLRDLAPTIAAELRDARWPELRARAAELAPASEAGPGHPLAPIAELARMKGNAIRGAEVFRRETVGCIKCHQVNGEGVEFGPNLSEIGTKLAREAIYEAILDPSAGISFGYEAWQLELRDGEEAFGLLASETEHEIAIKAQSGVVSPFKKADVTRRAQQKTSIMPSGLAEVMSQQDLVDLVEYLSSLRKDPASAAPSQ